MHINDFCGRKIHFIGIGGISMSGLALILAQNGYKISGSDQNPSAQVDKLIQNGLDVKIGHNAENVIGADLVIYTAAISSDNPELVYAREHNIPVLDRGTLLGQIMMNYRNVISIAGTHGKTTTTSMTASIFELSGL
ncbi:MAG TPA: Mur ligase domain-containing protein, partial [Clostridia bacterium]|nr:Mur ligase domain-containing protein [Clostridia bacterium]